MAHLNQETILAGIENRLPAAQVAHFEAHLAACEECQAETDEFSEFLQTLGEPTLVHAPEHALQKALDIFQTQTSSTAETLRLLATTLFDSFDTLQPAGLRGSFNARQLAMTSGGMDLHLSIDYQNAVIRGQFSLKNGNTTMAPLRINLLANESPRDCTISDDMGEFVFQNVPEDVDSLIVDQVSGVLLEFPLPYQPQGIEL